MIRMQRQISGCLLFIVSCMLQITHINEKEHDAFCITSPLSLFLHMLTIFT